MGRNFVIIIFTSNEAQDGRGLKAKVSFVEESRVANETKLKLQQRRVFDFVNETL